MSPSPVFDVSIHYCFSSSTSYFPEDKFPGFDLSEVDSGSKAAFTALVSAVNRQDHASIRQMTSPELAEHIISSIQVQKKPHIQNNPSAAAEPSSSSVSLHPRHRLMVHLLTPTPLSRFFSSAHSGSGHNELVEGNREMGPRHLPRSLRAAVQSPGLEQAECVRQ